MEEVAAALVSQLPMLQHHFHEGSGYTTVVGLREHQEGVEEVS
jgi:hypothetical protein